MADERNVLQTSGQMRSAIEKKIIKLAPFPSPRSVSARRATSEHRAGGEEERHLHL